MGLLAWVLWLLRGISLLPILPRLLVLPWLFVQSLLSLWSVQLQYFGLRSNFLLFTRPSSGWILSVNVFPKEQFTDCSQRLRSRRAMAPLWHSARSDIRCLFASNGAAFSGE
jgi:hypothetical protein